MKLNWINKLLFVVNISIGLALLGTNFSASFEPETAKYGYLLGLTYPYFLALNALFILYWAYVKKIHFLFSVAIILIGFPNLNRLMALNFTSTAEVNTHFNIMSFNVRLLNQYQWFEEENINDQIFDFIETQNPDIICFQEFIDSKELKLGYIRRMKELGYPFHKKEKRNSASGKLDFFGLITFSKFKIKDHGIARSRKDVVKAVSFYTDIETPQGMIRVYNTHLNSLGFISTDYQYLENITNTSEAEAIQKSKSIISKVITAARKRQREVNEIIHHFSQSPHPIILVGDFNEPPYSYAYPQIRTHLNDVFLKNGLGLGTTFDGISTLPGLRLDYILYGKSLTPTSYSRGPKNLSDHRPISAGFLLTK